MPTAQFTALAADRKRRLRRLRVERVTRPTVRAIGILLTGYAWGVIAVAGVLIGGPLTLVALIGAGIDVARGRA